MGRGREDTVKSEVKPAMRRNTVDETSLSGDQPRLVSEQKGVVENDKVKGQEQVFVTEADLLGGRRGGGASVWGVGSSEALLWLTTALSLLTPPTDTDTANREKQKQRWWQLNVIYC